MKEDVNDLLKNHTITICRSTVTKYREIKKSIQLTIFGCHNNPLSANELVVCLNSGIEMPLFNTKSMLCKLCYLV